ncbi:hypothetical protein RclHR1_02890005 [Rhizophagus clarus]|uniref:Uncharacterized protein n=1 Tax=Rhizophagus clarus TaxID=94130 RepID=A0A2Z6RYP8_9GLOM|nr:hypothetical protein RclHR1_02890005 [Rhizophagus clarus]GES98046.1 hypothetical protein GLOIN_2v412706 [Rhizophagus clarus]
MNTNNIPQNNFNNNDYGSNSHTTVTHAVTHSNVIYEQPPIPISSDQNHQQYYAYQQSTPNVSSNDIPQYNYQQSASDNNQNSLQSNVLPLLNSLNITINSPQTSIIIMPTTNSDIRQILSYLNHSSSSTNN